MEDIESGFVDGKIRGKLASGGLKASREDGGG